MCWMMSGMPLFPARPAKRFQLGDIVDVKLTEVAPVKGGLKFDMLSDGKKGAKPARVGRTESAALNARAGAEEYCSDIASG